MRPQSHLNQFFSFVTVTIFTTIGFGITTNHTASASKNFLTATTPYSTLRHIVFRNNFEPPGSAAPPQTKGAGSRTNNQCLTDASPIQTLMPQRNYALTTQARPSIFLRIPPRQQIHQAILTFRDQQRRIHAQVFVPITYAFSKQLPASPIGSPPSKNTADVVRLQLPPHVPALQVGQNYRWSVVLICGKTAQPDDPIFSGWVQRVSQQTQPLSELSHLGKAQWQAQRGYWYDMLTTLWNDAAPLQPAWQQVMHQYVLTKPRVSAMNRAGLTNQIAGTAQ